MLHFLDNLSVNFLNTLKRFPMVSLSAYLMTLILLIFSITGHGLMEKYPNYDLANKIAFLMTLAMPLFFVLKLSSKKQFMTLIGMALLVGYYFLFIPDNLENANSAFFQRHFLWIVALMIFSIVAPFLFRPTNNEDFWEWTQQIVFALLATLLFSIVLFLGLEGARYALEKLFNITALPRFKHRVEEIFMLTIFGLFSINYFLSQVPKNPLLITSRPYSKIENIFTKYILTPLVIIYFLILFAYTFKIIYLNQFPTGVLAWLVLIFSGLGIVTFLFWTPLWGEKIKKYKKLIWIAILLQTFVLAISIYMRIEQYGLTENRYFIALAGVWLFVTSLYFIVLKNASYKWIFITIPLLIVVSLSGPFSARELSKASQVEKLQTLLGTSMPLSEESNSTVKYQISSKIEYLFRKHGIDSLMPVIPEIVANYKLKNNKQNDCEAISYDGSFPYYATKKLGFNFIDKWQWEQNLRYEAKNIPIYIHSIYPNNTTTLNIKGYDWLQSFSFYNPAEEVNIRGPLYCPPMAEEIPDDFNNTTPFTLKTDNDYIHIEKEKKSIAKIKIDTFISTVKEKWEEQYKNNDKTLTPFQEAGLKPKDLTLEYEDSEIKVKFFFQSLEFSQKKHKLIQYNGRVLIHEK